MIVSEDSESKKKCIVFRTLQHHGGVWSLVLEHPELPNSSNHSLFGTGPPRSLGTNLLDSTKFTTGLMVTGGWKAGGHEPRPRIPKLNQIYHEEYQIFLKTWIIQSTLCFFCLVTLEKSPVSSRYVHKFLLSFVWVFKPTKIRRSTEPPGTPKFPQARPGGVHGKCRPSGSFKMIRRPSWDVWKCHCWRFFPRLNRKSVQWDIMGT